jgi:hypothetical protein
MLRRAAFFISLVISVCSLALGQSEPITVKPTSSVDPTLKPPEPEQQPIGPHLKPSDLDSRQTLNNTTRMDLIRLLDAEFVHTRKNFPLGDKNMVIGDDGTVKPGDDMLFRMAQNSGAAAKIGDRVQITNIVFREKAIYLEINGGPKKKQKWYQHIEVGVGGGSSPVDSNQVKSTGAALTIEFKKHVPEMTGAELKQILSPVLDFSVKTAAEVFADTLPPKIRQAVKNHEVLVGMNHDMVIMAKERPQQKIREKDDQGRPYEEWIYGALPQDVVFVRFVGDEVVLVKIAKVSGEVITKTQKEVQIADGVPTLTTLKSSDSPQDEKGGIQPTQTVHRPTLKRPDEQTEQEVKQQQQQQAGQPGTQTPQQDEPQWGTSGNPQPAGASQQQQPPPPDPQQTPEPELTKRPPL